MTKEYKIILSSKIEDSYRLQITFFLHIKF